MYRITISDPLTRIDVDFYISRVSVQVLFVTPNRRNSKTLVVDREQWSTDAVHNQMLAYGMADITRKVVLLNLEFMRTDATEMISVNTASKS